ncbi:MAG: hypothetical protein ACXVO9_13860 [Bacteroidia bacterium]
MKNLSLFLMVFLFCSLRAQDKIYFLDGHTLECRVLEISPEQVMVSAAEKESINRAEIFLIKYKNGFIEVMNTPTANVIYNPASKSKNQVSADTKIYKPGYLSLNTLALCNADIAAFYEYIPKSKIIGLGLMGAYNFNLNSTGQNSFITILPNAKKNFDLGATFNFYPGRLKKRTSLYLGMMIKYTSFNFNYTMDTTNAGGIIRYRATSGSQLATIFAIGTTTFFGEHFFLKTMAGLGSFKLNGDYKKQFNYEFNKNSGKNPHYFNSLPKIYLGLNIGYNF